MIGCAGCGGWPVRPDWITCECLGLCAELDLPLVRLRELRRGAVSLAGAAGVGLKVLHDAAHASAVTAADMCVLDGTEGADEFGLVRHVFAEPPTPRWRGPPRRCCGTRDCG